MGDRVLAWNEATGATGYYTVTATQAHADPVIVHLTIDGETIETTPEHPFYALETAPWLATGTRDGRWTPAGELQAGDHIQQADGTTGIVQAVVFEAAEQVMYDLTVANAHTFFVGDGKWLVHNSCGITKFPNNPDDLSTLLGTPGKDTISPIHGTRQIRWRSGNVEVRYESHIMDSGLFNSRHHGPHYHVGVSPDGAG